MATKIKKLSLDTKLMREGWLEARGCWLCITRSTYMKCVFVFYERVLSAICTYPSGRTVLYKIVESISDMRSVNKSPLQHVYFVLEVDWVGFVCDVTFRMLWRVYIVQVFPTILGSLSFQESMIFLKPLLNVLEHLLIRRCKKKYSKCRSIVSKWKDTRRSKMNVLYLTVLA